MNQHDDRIDRILQAMREASPPEGMADRITQRLSQAPHSSAARNTRLVWLAWLLPASPWARGAVAGALTTAVVFCSGLLLWHSASHHTTPSISALASQPPIPPTATPVALDNAAAPCTGPSSHPNRSLSVGIDTNARVPHSSRSSSRDEWERRSSPRTPALIPASFAPSHPAPPAPLTDQERALLHLVRTATPAQLAALNPAKESKSDAEREAAFQKFFAPSPELIAVERSEEEAAKAADAHPPQLKEVHN